MRCCAPRWAPHGRQHPRLRRAAAPHPVGTCALVSNLQVSIKTTETPYRPTCTVPRAARQDSSRSLAGRLSGNWCRSVSCCRAYRSRDQTAPAKKWLYRVTICVTRQRGFFSGVAAIRESRSLSCTMCTVCCIFKGGRSVAFGATPLSHSALYHQTAALGKPATS